MCTYICTYVCIYCIHVPVVVVAHSSALQVVNVDTIFWLEDRSPLGKVCASKYTHHGVSSNCLCTYVGV